MIFCKKKKKKKIIKLLTDSDKTPLIVISLRQFSLIHLNFKPLQCLNLVLFNVCNLSSSSCALFKPV